MSLPEPVPTVAEGMDLSCRVAMHDAAGRLDEAVCAQLDGNHAAARDCLDAAEAYLRRARKLCYATKLPPKPEQATLL